jgi:hypothetical protein
MCWDSDSCHHNDASASDKNNAISASSCMLEVHLGKQLNICHLRTIVNKPAILEDPFVTEEGNRERNL